MHLVSAEIKNYKSFLSSGPINFSPGFSVIVGQNDAGKTALIEGIRTRFNDLPHKSLKTVSHVGALVSQYSEVNLCIVFEENEITNMIINHAHEFVIQAYKEGTLEEQAKQFLHALTQKRTLSCAFRSGALISGNLDNFSTIKAVSPGSGIYYSVNHAEDQRGLQFNSNAFVSVAHAINIIDLLIAFIRERIYFFSAERMNIAESKIGIDRHLASNASNLAQVLNYLQSSNPARFQKLNELVTKIFPQIEQVTAPPISNDFAHIFIWHDDPSLERADLALSLSESGTGIGQVLAMLYVIVTSEYSRIIIIDEPQSFLHPGAIRKLFDVFKQYPQHQYIVTTHSPTVISSAQPCTLLTVHKKGAESVVEVVDPAKTQQLKDLLIDVGVKLSDVFGADSILWVEGRTEELCFPLILSEIAKQPLWGTEIVGVKSTGDLEGKLAKTVFEIYERLGGGWGFLPPAIGFIFDQEGRSETERDDLIRQSKDCVTFLPRRMYENYLLNPAAIAFVMSETEGFGNKITAVQIEGWLQDNRWESKYFGKKFDEAVQTDDYWLKHVHGAKILQDLFLHFSQSRVPYDKVTYGLSLTKWIIEHEPDDLAEVADLLKNVLSKNDSVP